MSLDSALTTTRPPVVFGSQAFESLRAEIAKGTLARDRGELDTRQAIKLVREARLGTLRLPAKFGGAGVSMTDLFKIVIALSEADSNISHIIRNHFAVVERALQDQNNPKFRKLIDLAGQGKLFGLSSSELNMKTIGDRAHDTKLEPHGDGYRLNGKKFYSTGNYYVDVILVAATLPDGSLATAIVPTDREGIRIDDDWDGMGQRLTASGTTDFTNVAVSKDEIMFPGEEQRQPYRSTITQLYLTAIIAGIAKAVLTDAIRLMKGRDRNFYHALASEPAEDPQLHEALGRLSSIAYASEATVLAAAEALGRASDATIAGRYDPALTAEASAQAVKAKIIVDQLALDAATRLFDVGGASASRKSLRLDRHWQNIRTLASHNPVSYKARAIGALEVLGTPLPLKAFF